MIHSFRKSFIDFERHISMLISLQGCNFDCWFCPDFHLKKRVEEGLHIQEVLKNLEENLNTYQAVVITGGEPTIWGDKLVSFIEKINSLNLPIQLNTNGSNPRVLEKLLNRGLLLVVAMSIKHDLFNFDRMRQTIGIDYGNKEWRDLMNSLAILSRYVNVIKIYKITLIPTLHEVHFIKMLRTLRGTWDSNSILHLYEYDPAVADTSILAEEVDLESYEKIIKSFEFRYRFKDF